MHDGCGRPARVGPPDRRSLCGEFPPNTWFGIGLIRLASSAVIRPALTP
jgi:hypothetical protein